jgi:hypothetical protein
MTSGLFASAVLGSAPTTNASCASFFGIGNSAECSSTLFSAAVAFGEGSQARAATSADSGLNLATALFGDNNVVTASGGVFNFATNIGGNNNAVTTQGSLVNTATNCPG